MTKILYQRKPLSKWKGYFVDTNGNVFSYRKSYDKLSGFLYPLKQEKLHSGYKRVKLHQNNYYKKILIHRLVLETFIEECPKDMECRHLNGIRDDNRLENLQWGTKRENQLDRYTHNTMNPLKGSKHGMSKLNDFQVKRIRLLKEIIPAITQKRLSKMFNIDRTMIGNILKRKNWKHI